MSTAIHRGYVEAPSGQIHYRRAGRPGAPVLILLHQTPSHSGMYEPLMGALAADFDLTALDTPGFGLSDPLREPFTIAAAANSIAAAARELSAEPCAWFGHHTGAALALQVASDFPEQVRALAMSGPCLLDEMLRTRLPQVAAKIDPQRDGRHLQALWQRLQAKDPEAPINIIERELIAALAAGDAYPAAYAAVVQVDTEAQLRALRCPTLVFAGTKDPLHPQLDAAYRLLADGRKAEIEGARTFVCERQVDPVSGLLKDFLGAQHV